MTLLMAWERQAESGTELVLAADSRLRSGCAWDCGPKLFPTSRGDCAIGFLGDTQFAYPMVAQALNAIDHHQTTKSRIRDLHVLKGHLVRVMSGMLKHVHDLPIGQSTSEIPRTEIVLAGFSWLKQAFCIWKFIFDPQSGGVRTVRVNGLRNVGIRGLVAVLGNPSMSDACRRRHSRGILKWYDPPELVEKSHDVRLLAMRQLIKRTIAAKPMEPRYLDMEPFQVLVDVTRTRISPHVGGAPQLLKIYRHLNTQPFAVRWNEAKKTSYSLLGRPLLPYELPNVPFIDSDSLRFLRRRAIPTQ